MTKRIVKFLCIACALSMVASFSQGGDVFLSSSGDFHSAANWSDGMVPSNGGDFYFIQDALTADFAVGNSTSVARMIVSDSSVGTLDIKGGELTITGGGESFVIGRGCCAGGGTVDLSGTSILRTAPGDTGFIGQRDSGTLHVGPNARVISDSVWRIGQFGPVIDAGLEGNGLLDVEGMFSARLLFLGVDDGDGRLRISGQGSVTLSENLQPSVNTFYPNRSSTIEMIGSGASLVARGLESANGPTQVKNQYLFAADAGGVSPIRLVDALNIDNNKLTVDLTNFALAPGMSITLFDAAPERVFGTFAEVSILGVVNPGNYSLVYDAGAGGSGDIRLTNVIPEPASIVFIVFGTMLSVYARRRTSK
jgi:hypothetical protein